MCTFHITIQEATICGFSKCVGEGATLPITTA